MMKLLKSSSLDLRILFFLFCFAFWVLFFVSPDSYFNDLHSRGDEGWFFMCGKAWMKGLIPYVDFSDSKGPLLWLLYGIGYLFHHSDYLGMFWIAVLWYGAIFYLVYKIAHLFLPGKKALICTILMAVSFFNPWFHSDIRAEDFCHLFLLLSLYALCRIAWTEKYNLLKGFFILGCSFMALVLIKYNIAVMQAFMIIAALYICIKEKYPLIKPCLYGILGAFSVFLPFLICFLVQGNLGAFFQEYFIKTFSTISDGKFGSSNILLESHPSNNPILVYLMECADLIYKPEIGALLLFCLLGNWLLARMVPKYKALTFFLTLGFFAITLRHHLNHYFNACAILPLFFFIFIAHMLDKDWWNRTRILLLSICVIGFIAASHILTWTYKTMFFYENQARTDFYTMTSYMSQVKDPTLAYVVVFENGSGVLAEALPAGKYWSQQLGMPPEMFQEHKELLLSGKSDFIIISDEKKMEKDYHISLQDFLDIGYCEYYRFGEHDNACLLSKHMLVTRNPHIPSKWDILLKRNLK